MYFENTDRMTFLYHFLQTYELDTPDGVSKEERADVLPEAEYIPSPRDHKEDPPPSMSGVKKFFLVMLVLLGLMVCVVVGMMIYQNQQDNSRKRFY